MPTAQSNSQCPYCDHVSPTGSKFCNECGAALHLRPCPHCGSVNDVSSSTHCSRCNGDLGFGATADASEASGTHATIAAEAPANQPPLLSEAVEFTQVQAEREPEPAPTMLATAQLKPARSYAPLIAFAVIAAAAIGFFGLRSDPVIEADKAASMQSPAPSPTLAPTPAPPTERPISVEPEKLATSSASTEASGLPPAEPVNNTSEPSPKKDAAPSPAFAASLARLSPPGAGRPVAARREIATPPAGAAAAPAEGGYSTGPRSRPPGEGLELKQPNLGSCTDAVAALGLCTKESNPRSP